ncbi:DUF2339 domain-containing protein [Moraxella equi]|uniref:Predicted membrane protein n=1 Tax=Moraxella equi TaxID=60442 RepID=A0A378QU93_9GAMM|nr:DUF2339 domain-containing protein [Moraxella equi]OPH40030.1 hypothetical protein B5J93_01105 [Moraxella equi]STZ04489.1 Predicted membrane protein [Moraxella equi]
MAVFATIVIIVLFIMVLGHKSQIDTLGERLDELQNEINRLYKELDRQKHANDLRHKASLNHTIAHTPAPSTPNTFPTSDPLANISPTVSHQPPQSLSEPLPEWTATPFSPTTDNHTEIPSHTTEQTNQPTEPINTQPLGQTEPITTPSLPTNPKGKARPHFKKKIKPTKRPEPMSVIQPVLAWFGKGNPILKVGIVVLFLGLAFLLKLASHYIETPLWLRYLAVGVSGLIATGVGLRLTQKRRDYGLILQGFGLAVMYLTTLASLKLAHLLSPTTAFVLMVLAVVAKIALAVRQDAKILAQIALLGGLATPLLTATGSNNYLALFAYLATLNTGITVIANWRAWRSLNAISVTGTFFIAFLWQGGLDDGERLGAWLASTAFGVYHLALYGYMVCAYSRTCTNEQLPSLANDAPLAVIFEHYIKSGLQAGKVDAGVLFGSALAGFLFLYNAVTLVGDKATMLMAFGLAGLYVVFALLTKTNKDNEPTLAYALWLLTGLFVALGIGLGFDGRLAIGLWALQGALVYAFGLRQQAVQVRCFALLLFVLSAILWFGEYHDSYGEHILAGNGLGSDYGTLWQVLAGFLVYGLWNNWQGADKSARWETSVQNIGLGLTLTHVLILPSLWFGELATTWVLIVGLILLGVWAYRTCNKVVAVVAPVACAWTLIYAIDLLNNIGIVTLSSGLAMLILAGALHLNPHQETKRSPLLLWSGVLTILFGLAGLMTGFGSLLENRIINNNLHFGWSLWASFAVLAVFVKVAKVITNRHWHALALISLSFMLLMALTLINTVLESPTTLALAVLGIASVGLGAIIIASQTLRPLWANRVHFANLALVLGVASLMLAQSPLESLAHLWGVASLILLGAVLFVPYFGRFANAYQKWGVLLCLSVASLWLVDVAVSQPVAIGSRLPVINAVDMVQLGLAVLFVKALNTQAMSLYRSLLIKAGAVLVWLCVSAVVVRTWHFYGGVAWDFGAFFGDFGIQTSLSLLWAVMGIGLMMTGTKREARSLWVVGVSLIGVVVGKLFLIDLGNSGGVARIVSFIGVGLGLLLVGWFAPAPPKGEH